MCDLFKHDIRRKKRLNCNHCFLIIVKWLERDNRCDNRKIEPLAHKTHIQA